MSIDCSLSCTQLNNRKRFGWNDEMPVLRVVVNNRHEITIHEIQLSIEMLKLLEEFAHPKKGYMLLPGWGSEST